MSVSEDERLRGTLTNRPAPIRVEAHLVEAAKMQSETEELIELSEQGTKHSGPLFAMKPLCQIGTYGTNLRIAVEDLAGNVDVAVIDEKNSVLGELPR